MEGEGVDFGDSFPAGSTEPGEALQAPQPGQHLILDLLYSVCVARLTSSTATQVWVYRRF